MTMSLADRGYYALYRRALAPAYERVVKRRGILTRRAQLEASQWWPRERLAAYQWGELCRLLAFAERHVPYWRDTFARVGLTASAVETYETFRRLPILTKEIIRRDPDAVTAVPWRGRAWTKATGGSTGVPLEFAYTPENYDWRVAATKRGYGWAGCEDGIKQAHIWGVALGEIPWGRRLKEALHHRVLRQRYFNSFAFDEVRMRQCLEALNRYRPAIVVGYTNPLYYFARFIERHGGLRARPNVVMTGAEQLHEVQRALLSRVFGCPVFNTYGSREFMLIAAECEEHRGLHISAEHLFVEVLRDDGTPAAPGERGRVVITDLHNEAMPFIRYEIGDLAVAAEGACPCGRGLPLLGEVVGRSLDVIRTPEGRIVPGEFFPHLMKEFRGVQQFQVIQRALDRLTLKIVRHGAFDAQQMETMRREIRRVVGERLQVDVEFVESIPLTPTGKLRVTISEIA